MTEASTAQAATVAPPVTPVSLAEKRAQAESLLTEILKHMEYPAKLDWKEMPDGGLGVAVHFEGELPGITPGKRSYLLDCLQFLVNKVVNRPNTEKRWVSLGANAFPEPRPERGGKGQPAAQAPQAAPAGGDAAPNAPRAPAAARPTAGKTPPGPTAARPPPKAQEKRPQEQRRGGEPDERTLEVPEDPAFTAAVKALAEKCARVGRTYALAMLSPQERARALKAAEGVAGLKTRLDGEGVLRRVVFVPDKPAPLPKRTSLPDDEDEEE